MTISSNAAFWPCREGQIFSAGNAVEALRIILGGLITLQYERLIEDHSGGSIPGMRIATLRVRVPLRTECRKSM